MTGRLPAPLRLYRLATRLLTPAAPVLLRRRAAEGKEDPARLAERLGVPSLPRPAGELVWAHGASIGEALALLPVVEALVARGLPVLATSGTRTSAAVLASRLPAGALHQFMPVDGPRFLRRFLDHWRPRLAVFSESEVWPNVVLELDRRSIPLVLANGRMSERSARGWSRAPGSARALFGRLAACLPQGEADARRLAALGAPVTAPVGNLKFDAAPPPADPAEVERLSGLLAGRAVWLAASTHPGEDETILDAHRALAAHAPGLVTIVAPRHPARGPAVEALAAAAGLSAGRRSTGASPGADDVHVVDRVGELGLFYRAAPVAFMGGSLAPHGGQNPIEPIRLGAAVLHGPRTENFADLYAALDAAGGARLAADGAAIAAALRELLGEPARLRAMGRSGQAVVASFGGALGRTLDALAPFLPSPLEAAGPAARA